MSGKEFRHSAGILAVQADAGNQRLQPTENEPAVKWRQDSAPDSLERFNAGCKFGFLPEHYRSAQDITV